MQKKCTIILIHTDIHALVLIIYIDDIKQYNINQNIEI